MICISRPPTKYNFFPFFLAPCRLFMIFRKRSWDDESLLLYDVQCSCSILFSFAKFLNTRNGIFILLRIPGIDSVSLCGLAGRYDNPIPTRFLAPIDCYKIPALVSHFIPAKMDRVSHCRTSSHIFVHLCQWRQFFSRTSSSIPEFLEPQVGKYSPFLCTEVDNF